MNFLKYFVFALSFVTASIVYSNKVVPHPTLSINECGIKRTLFVAPQLRLTIDSPNDVSDFVTVVMRRARRHLMSDSLKLNFR